MADTEAIPEHASFKAAIQAFIQGRLQAKLEQLDKAEQQNKPLKADRSGKVLSYQEQRQELRSKYQPEVWLCDAAKRVKRIQSVTHSLKAIHPDAQGTNLFVALEALPKLRDIGSHVLGHRYAADVVGDAAALDVYKLLKLEVKGQSLLSALQAADTEAVQALGDDPATAQQLRDAFVSLTEARSEGPSSHTHAKQLYWLVGEDASDDAQYELLTPLYATSLAHAVHATIQEHRFGEANKAARQARKERKHHDGVYCEYRDLAVQKLGGTKPQNISQLNSERGGVNYLLSSLPPVWTASSQRLPVNTESVFDRLFGARPEVRRGVKALRDFLTTDPDPNLETRQRRETLVDGLIDELVIFAAGYQQTLPAGWSKDKRFAKLDKYQQLWLDPSRALENDETPFMPNPDSAEQLTFAQAWQWLDWPAEIGKAFARWLNQSLGESFGDAEARVWRKELLTDEDGFKQQLRDNRNKLNAPHYIPIRKTHAELVAEKGGVE